MGQKRHTRDSIIQTLQNVAASLGKTTLSTRDVKPHLPLSVIKYHFGNVGTALKAAGMSVAARDPSAIGRRSRLDDEVLFASLLEVEEKIGHAPNFPEYRANSGALSNTPFRSRFGNWARALEHYSKWKAERGALLDTSHAIAFEETMDGETDVAPVALPSESPIRKNRKPPQLFGEPIDFRGLRHAPINEQGVVYLFGMVSRELGFSVEALQQGFPDCEGKYLHDKNRKLWAKARIEFEFKASNFREHGHDEDGCDFIVCWENDWPDCPLRVVELKSEIMRLPSR